MIDRHFTATTAPETLAVFRIAVFTTLIAFVLTSGIPWLSGVPEELRVLPVGSSWFLTALPPTEAGLWWLQALFLVACTAALIGWQTRIACWVAVVVGLYVLAIPVMFGKINHNHHLWWFALLLATSPCGDALSVDAWRRGTVYGPSTAYTWPIRCAWILIGLVYLVPGLAKAFVGPAWITPRNMALHLYTMWLDQSLVTGAPSVPWLRFDESPRLLLLSAIGTIAFEVSFLPLMFTRWRSLAVMGGLAFHQMTRILMGISFWTLWVCYVVFVDWVFLRQRAPNTMRKAPTFASVVCGLALIAAAAMAAWHDVDGWPIGVYPRFNYLPAEQARHLELVFRRDDGTTYHSPATPELAQRFPPSVWFHLTDRVVHTTDPARQRELSAGLWELYRRVDPTVAEMSTLELWAVRKWRDPRRWSENPIDRSLVFTVPRDE
jgi:hypothetical protein